MIETGVTESKSQSRLMTMSRCQGRRMERFIDKNWLKANDGLIAAAVHQVTTLPGNKAPTDSDAKPHLA